MIRWGRSYGGQFDGSNQAGLTCRTMERDRPTQMAGRTGTKVPATRAAFDRQRDVHEEPQASILRVRLSQAGGDRGRRERPADRRTPPP